MGSVHEAILSTVFEERARLMSRRGFFGRALKAGVGGTAAVALAGSPKLGGFSALAAMATPEMATPEADFSSDVDVLNYALTLEHLEYAFYRDGVGMFDFGADAFGNSINAYLMDIRDHEKAHVDTLTKVITDMKGTPVKEATYDFGYGSDMQKFLATAAALENTGVSAYDGAGQYLKSADLLTAAGGIVAVEARHASYLNLITGAVPFPAAFEQAKSKAEILAIAGPFIKS
jgi:rubrerythrin